MTAITYVASRSIASGHAAGTTYSFDVGMSAIDRERKAVRVRHQALSGTPETLLNRIDYFWHFGVSPIDMDAVALAYLNEFLDSVSGGESFSIDPYGTVAAPVAPLNCELTSDSHKDQRDGARAIKFSFSVRQL